MQVIIFNTLQKILEKQWEEESLDGLRLVGCSMSLDCSLISTSPNSSTRWSLMQRIPSPSLSRSASLTASSGRTNWPAARSNSSMSLRSTPPSHACTPWETTSPALRPVSSPSFTTVLKAPNYEQSKSRRPHDRCLPTRLRGSLFSKPDWPHVNHNCRDLLPHYNVYPLLLAHFETTNPWCALRTRDVSIKPWVCYLLICLSEHSQGGMDASSRR